MRECNGLPEDVVCQISLPVGGKSLGLLVSFIAGGPAPCASVLPLECAIEMVSCMCRGSVGRTQCQSTHVRRSMWPNSSVCGIGHYKLRAGRRCLTTTTTAERCVYDIKQSHTCVQCRGDRPSKSTGFVGIPRGRDVGTTTP